MNAPVKAEGQARVGLVGERARTAVQAFRAAIHGALGQAPDTIEPGNLHRFATSDRRGDDAGWCKLFHDLRGGVFGCHRQGIAETWSATPTEATTRQQRAELARQLVAATTERHAAQRGKWAENAQHIAALWARCVPLVPGDAVTMYLKNRGFVGVWPLPACLQFHAGLPYWHGGEKLGVFPAMVAPLTSADGHFVALHRTFLTRDGRKADVPTPKKLTPAAGPLAGACIPLFKPKAGSIGIAEGIETAIAAWLASGIPTVAAYCAGNMTEWQWPAGVRRVVVFADADHAGCEAAAALRARALRAGLACEVLTPSEHGTDWADTWAASRAVGVAA